MIHLSIGLFWQDFLLLMLLFGAMIFVLWRSIGGNSLRLRVKQKTLSSQKSGRKGGDERVAKVKHERKSDRVDSRQIDDIKVGQMVNTVSTTTTDSSHNGANLHPWTEAEFQQLDHRSAQRLLKAYPNMATLELSLDYYTSPMVDEVIYLLRNWSHSLRTLKLSADELAADAAERLPQLFATFDLMPVLTHLTLDVRHQIFATAKKSSPPPQQQQQLDLQILIQLHEFYFASLDRVDVILRSLQQYAANNPNLRTIGIANCLTSSTFEHFLQFPLDFASRFTHLTLASGGGGGDGNNSMSTIDPNRLRIFCSKFCSLTSFALDMGTIGLAPLTRCLAPLTKLEHLELAIDFHQQSSWSLADVVDGKLRTSSAIGSASSTSSSASNLDAPPHLSLIETSDKSKKKVDKNYFQLPSIKVLTLALSTTAHTDMCSERLAWIFPALETVRVWPPQRKSACSICDWTNQATNGQDDIDQSSSFLRRECCAQLLAPWKQCPALRRIVVDIYESSEHELSLDDHREDSDVEDKKAARMLADKPERNEIEPIPDSEPEQMLP